MKRYMKSKDFIPEKFYNKKLISRNKKETGIILLFLVLNLMLLPTIIEDIEETNKAAIINNTNIENDKLSDNEFDKINIWIENIFSDDIEEVYINKNKGEIIINSLENIDRLSTNKFITISDVNLKNDGKYKLGVNLNE